MQPVAPIDVLELFPSERAALLDVLASLSEHDWRAPTACDGWSVKDLAAHILGDDVGLLSRGRDGYSPAPFAAPNSWDELVAFINRQNEEWVAAMRRVSPRVLTDALDASGEATYEHFASLDPEAIGEPVFWAGPDPAPVWMHLAREYTERWAHQQQIRDATARPGLKDARHFAPVLDTYVRALPHTYRGLPAEEGTVLELAITGDAGGTWSMRREGGGWMLYAAAGGPPSARVTLDQDAAWRLMTKGLSRAKADRVVVIEGDRVLGERALEIVSIMA